MRGHTSAIALICAALVLGFLSCGCDAPQVPQVELNGAASGEYLFCFWNVENLFDDQLDHRTGPGDKEYDPWMAGDPETLKLKLKKLCDALLAMNDGKGPDILAICEVENVRAAELLQKALNDRIPDPKLHYANVLMKEVSVGRHIAPAILTRLPVVKPKTRSFGNRFRIVQGHVVVGGHELIVLASHWTSRLKDGSDRGRGEYADKLYGAVNAMFLSNPAVDVIVCGDFNAAPDDEAVTGNLHATGDRNAVTSHKPMRLLNLLADKDARNGFGTHYYKKWLMYDHVVVSPGMLDDSAWSCDPASLKVVQSLAKPGDRLGRPWRFGSENDKGPRGYSDHFPVTVRVKVQR